MHAPEIWLTLLKNYRHGERGSLSSRRFKTLQRRWQGPEWHGRAASLLRPGSFWGWLMTESNMPRSTPSKEEQPKRWSLSIFNGSMGVGRRSLGCLDEQWSTDHKVASKQSFSAEAVQRRYFHFEEDPARISPSRLHAKKDEVHVFDCLFGTFRWVQLQISSIFPRWWIQIFAVFFRRKIHSMATQIFHFGDLIWFIDRLSILTTGCVHPLIALY